MLAIALAKQSGFSDDEWSSIESGRVMARVVDSDDPSEVVSIAGMTASVSRDRFLACVRDPICLQSQAGLTQSGRIAAAPKAADFGSLTLDARELEQLATCRLGRCLTRLGEGDIARIQAEVDWASPRHGEQAARVFRDVLAAYATAYVRGGNPALPIYRDKATPTPVGERLGALLTRPSWVLDEAPGLRTVLDSPPAGSALGERYLFWSNEKFWRKPLIAMNEVAVHEVIRPGWRWTFVAIKQLYASHYHEAALDLIAFGTDDASGRSYVLFFGRMRAAVRPSGFGWLERKLVRRLVRRRLEDRFAAMRERLQAAPGPLTR